MLAAGTAGQEVLDLYDWNILFTLTGPLGYDGSVGHLTGYFGMKFMLPALGAVIKCLLTTINGGFYGDIYRILRCVKLFSAGIPCESRIKGTLP